MKRIILLLMLLSVVATGKAQLKIVSDGRLLMGDVQPFSYYTTHWSGWGHYYSWNGVFMEFCLGAGSPRIAGSGDQVVFFNTETSTFNSLQVQNIYNYSDINDKINVIPLALSIETLKKIKPVSFNWKVSEEPNNPASKFHLNKEMGFIAQDVEAVIPDIVITNSDGKKLLNYSALIPILIQSVKDLSSKVDSLSLEVNRLKTGKP